MMRDRNHATATIPLRYRYDTATLTLTSADFLQVTPLGYNCKYSRGQCETVREHLLRLKIKEPCKSSFQGSFYQDKNNWKSQKILLKQQTLYLRGASKKTNLEKLPDSFY